jgi:hypothetical protein
VHPDLHATFRALSLRGGPISAGWNRTAAASVHCSARAISFPMLAIPGWSESRRLPNAVAVVSALKTQRASGLTAAGWSGRLARP